MDLIRETQILTGHCRGGVFSSATEIQELLYASYFHQNGGHLLKTEACSTMSYNSSAKRGFIRISKGLPTSTQQCFLTLTQVFSGGLTAEKSAGNTKALSKWSSTLQHLLTTSARDIASGVSLVGSFTPSYMKVGCFRHCRDWIR